MKLYLKKDDAPLVEAMTADGRGIEIGCQLSNSPDMNLLDLSCNN